MIAAADFGWRENLDLGRDVPDMTERILDLGRPFPVKLVSRGPQHSGTLRGCSLDKPIYIRNLSLNPN